MTTLRVALLALVLLSPLAPAASVPPGLAEPCPLVPGLGAACREGALWRVPLADGTSVLTHGGDPAPALEDPLSAAAAPPPAPVVCVGDPESEPHGHVLYTRPPDKPSRLDDLAPSLRQIVLDANGVLRADSAARGAPMTYRMRCAQGEIEVTEVVLLTGSADDTFSTMMNELRLQGYDSALAKYWIWHDDDIDCGCAGIGTLSLDERRSSTNANGAGPSYGANFGYLGASGAYVSMHENGHNLGAVQDAAPHSSGAGHCNDGLDIMCYGDGGPTSAYSGGRCTDRRHFDCGHDTYFDPRPTNGEWLATRWNLGSPLNRFLSGCLYATGSLVAGANGVQVEGVTMSRVAVPSTCVGRPYAVYAEADAAADDFNVCWYAAGTLVECDAQRWQDLGVVPAGVDEARVVYALGAGGSWTLSVV